MATVEKTLSPDEAFGLARAHMESGNYAAARKLCEAVLRIDADSARAHYLLGTIAFETDDTESAIAHLEHAIEADPGALDYYEYLQVLLGSVERTDAAQRVASRAARAKLFSAKFGSLPRNIQDYQRTVDALRESRYMDYPREVAIETMAVCNAACVFCPYPDLARKGEKMPDALVDKILRDLEDIPRDLPFSISPFKVNDPLLDVRIFDIMERCNERLPGASLRLFTNGSPLTERHLQRIGSIRNFEHLWVSLNHHDPQRYEAVMKLPWQRTIEKLDMVHARKAAGKFAPKVIVSRVGDGSADDAAFLDLVRTRYPLFKRAMVAQSEWLGQVEGLLGSSRLHPVGCARWYELSITATGKVAFCCMDGKAEYAIGEAASTHVLDIYNSPGYRMYRERFATRRDGAPCRACTNR